MKHNNSCSSIWILSNCLDTTITVNMLILSKRIILYILPVRLSKVKTILKLCLDIDLVVVTYKPSSTTHAVANNDVQLISLQESSYQYWPPVGQVIVFGEYTVDLISEEPLTGFTVRKISVLDKKVRFLCLNHSIKTTSF